MLGYADFVRDVKELDGSSATFVSIQAETKVKVLKKDRATGEPVDGSVYKRQKLTALINFSYEDAVKRRDLSYEVGQRQWGAALQDEKNPAIIEKNNNLYLQVMPMELQYKELFSPDGDISKLQNMDIFPSKKSGNTPVMVRAYKLSSITYAKVNGKEYDLTV